MKTWQNSRETKTFQTYIRITFRLVFLRSAPKCAPKIFSQLFWHFYFLRQNGTERGKEARCLFSVVCSLERALIGAGFPATVHASVICPQTHKSGSMPFLSPPGKEGQPRTQSRSTGVLRAFNPKFPALSCSAIVAVLFVPACLLWGVCLLTAVAVQPQPQPPQFLPVLASGAAVFPADIFPPRGRKRAQSPAAFSRSSSFSSFPSGFAPSASCKGESLPVGIDDFENWRSRSFQIIHAHFLHFSCIKFSIR